MIVSATTTTTSPTTSFPSSSTLGSSSYSTLPPLRPEDLAIDTKSIGGYSSLPPLRPEDLSPVRAAPKAVLVPHEKPFNVGEVYDELREKMRNSIIETPISSVLYIMRMINMIMAILMIIIAFFTLISTKSVWSGVSDIFSSLYTIMFAILLIGYEARSAKFDQYLRENFGFMYSSFGRCAFLIFISIFPFSMGVYGILISCLGIVNAYFNYFVITKHPSFSEGIPEYKGAAMHSPEYE